MVTTTNRESAVAWMKSGFNAGQKEIVDNMVANETKLHRQASLQKIEETDESSSDYQSIGDAGSYSSTSTISRYAEPFLEEERKRDRLSRVNSLRQEKRKKENSSKQNDEESSISACLNVTRHTHDSSFVDESSSSFACTISTGTNRDMESFLEEKKRVQLKVKTIKKAKKKVENSKMKEEPINILVFDGGGMRVVSTCALIDEIEKISSELGYGDDWVSRFDLIAGSSAGGICSILLANTTSTSDMVELGQGLVNEMATKAFSKLNIFNIFKDCQGLGKESQFDNVVMDFLKEDIPAKNDDGLKSFALCAARHTNDHEAKIKPFLLRKYDLPENAKEKAMAGSSNFSIHNAIHSTSALPGIVRMFKTYHEKEPISLADGGFISVAPLAEAIMEAQILYPNRKIGVVVSIGLNSSNDRSCYQTIDIARINNPNIHFHRIVPEEARWK
ncbi:hypothetical protein CTEN210_00484 [Chaetoceros tenuissimus]|uniref:PNPLA domain-containing protein n=1 Tax=Chaetoceros tenuissimus TaxID=426638 RepID=A0AAD3CG45_9STRA|nr:hypothetical protein CTEN210_00484 [Chaetoceros tenuissimus]